MKKKIKDLTMLEFAKYVLRHKSRLQKAYSKSMTALNYIKLFGDKEIDL